MRITEVFKDFDTLRTGFVSKDRFSSVVGQFGVRLSQPEINALVHKYGASSKKNQVNWEDFATDVEVVFTDPSIVKTPKGTINSLTDTLSKLTTDLTPTLDQRGFTDDMLTEVDAIHTRLTEHVKRLGENLEFFYRVSIVSVYVIVKKCQFS